MEGAEKSSLFQKYLASKNIQAVSSRRTILHMQDAVEQLRLIGEFHKKAAGYRQYDNEGLRDNLGRNVEKYKSDIKRLKRLLYDIKNQGAENAFEEVLYNTGSQVKALAEKAVTVSCNDKYLDIIKRSMERVEICIGNPFYDNLYSEGNILQCGIENCVYDLVESDCVVFIRRLRRKGIEVDQDFLIKEFCRIEELDSYSVEYISSLMQYPYYLIKMCIRYKEHKKAMSPEAYLDKYRKAIKFDGIKMRL